MSRPDAEAYQAELAFLKLVAARVETALARQVRSVAIESPELADEAQQLVADPIDKWAPTVNPELLAAIGGLKAEQAIVDTLVQVIEATPLTQAIEKRLTSLQRREADLIKDEPGAQYLRDGAYWRSEETQAILNQLFSDWARWLRGEPLEVP